MKSNLGILITFILLAGGCFLPAKVHAQMESVEVVSLSVRINDPLEISVDDSHVAFEFENYADYQNGLGGEGSSYTTNATIRSSSNLKMKVISLNPMLHEDGVSEIPLDNINYSTELSSTENLGVSLHSLTESALTNIPGTPDIQTEKNLTIRWEMGTGKLASQNLVNQNLKSGNYSTEVMVLFTEEI